MEGFPGEVMAKAESGSCGKSELVSVAGISCNPQNFIETTVSNFQPTKVPVQSTLGVTAQWKIFWRKKMLTDFFFENIWSEMLTELSWYSSINQKWEHFMTFLAYQDCNGAGKISCCITEKFSEGMWLLIATEKRSPTRIFGNNSFFTPQKNINSCNLWRFRQSKSPRLEAIWRF